MYNDKTGKNVAWCSIVLALGWCCFFTSCQSGVRDTGLQTSKQLDRFELRDALNQGEITVLQEIIDMYGRPYSQETVEDDETLKRYFFEVDERVLVLVAKSENGKIRGHQIVTRY